MNATEHKYTFRCNVEQSQIDDMLAKLITAMTKEGKFKNTIQDKIGTTVDTMNLEKQLSVLNASLHYAETIPPALNSRWIIWMLQIFITIKNIRFTETIECSI